MISQRTQSLIERVPDHALAPKVKDAIVGVFSASERYVGKRAELEKSGTYTDAGLRKALRDTLPAFVRDLTKARAPVEKALADGSRRAALKPKPVDKTDVVAALDRQEVRAWLRGLDPMALQTLATTTSDQRVLEAIVTAPAELSGFTGNIAHVYGEVETRLAEIQFGPQMQEVEALEAVVAEGVAAAQIALNDIQRATGMADHEFAALVTPIEKRVGAPWLLKNGDKVQVVEVQPDKTAAYRDATEADVAGGVFYPNFEAYQAAQAA